MRSQESTTNIHGYAQLKIEGACFYFLICKWSLKEVGLITSTTMLVIPVITFKGLLLGIWHPSLFTLV
jgi:hypothetical protein